MARPGHDGSTGHGTGRSMPVPLALILERDRYRVMRKKALRARKQRDERGRPLGVRRHSSGAVRDHRGRSVSRASRGYYREDARTPGDLKGWWQSAFKRACEKRDSVGVVQVGGVRGFIRSIAGSLGLA